MNHRKKLLPIIIGAALLFGIPSYGAGLTGNEQIYISDPSENIQVVCIELADGTSINKYQRTDGTDITEAIYEFADDFYGGKALVRENGIYKMIDTTGAVIMEFPASYGQIMRYSINKDLYVATENDNVHHMAQTYCLLNADGTPMTDMVYQDLWVSVGDREKQYPLRAKKINEGYGYLDKNGKELIPFVYDYTYEFNSGIGNVSKGEKCALIDANGTFLTDFIYDTEIPFHDGLGVYESGGTTKILNTKAETIVEQFNQNVHVASGAGYGEPSYYVGDVKLRQYLIDNNLYSDDSLTGQGTTVPSEPTITLRFNGKVVEFDQPPVLMDGRTMLPIRVFGDEMGYEIDWEPTTQTVTVSDAEKAIVLTVGSQKATITYANSGQTPEVHTLDVSAQLVNSRTLVPVRFITEALGAAVDWDPETWTVDVTVN